MLTLAITTFDGMVVDDYYKHGKEINLVKDRDHAAQHLQLSAILGLSPDTHKVRLQLRHRPDYQAPRDMHLKLLFATRAGYDIDILLRRQTDGTYLGKLPAMHQGRWDVLLAADNWRLLGSIHAPEEHSLRLDTQPSGS
jgi:hypothetical protein